MRTAALMILLVTGAGCATQVKHPGFGTWDDSVLPLGKVVASRGGWWRNADPEDTGWALALNVPPDPFTYYSALLDKAVKTYYVPREEVVLGEVSVDLLTEVVGTVRAWKATAVAGRRTR